MKSNCAGGSLGGIASAILSVPYSVAASAEPWPVHLGHHRARVQVVSPAAAVRVHLPWRLQFAGMEAHAMIVSDPAGTQLVNVIRTACSRESADVVFEAATAGEYAVYFLPYRPHPQWGAYGGDYLPYAETARPDWRQANSLDGAALEAGKWKTLPEATLIEFQARSEFDRFDPMEVVATADEMAAFKSAHPQPLLLFPEDRKFPIRMLGDLPLRWIKAGPSAEFSGVAQPNEYYVFQIGAFAPVQNLANLKVVLSPLSSPGKEGIPPGKLTCFNLGGIDSHGREFVKAVSLAAGKVQPLWCGVDIGARQAPGLYTGHVTVSADGVSPQTVTVKLAVTGEPLADRGDGDLWRMARLRWLNSTAGAEETVIAPYTPLELRDKAITCLGRQVTLGEIGLPTAIRAGSNPVLAGPVRFVAETEAGNLAFEPSQLRFTHRSDARIGWELEARAAAATLVCKGEMEFDGYLRYSVTITPAAELKLKDARLEFPVHKEAAEYLMGAGLLGGTRPARHEWRWIGPYDSFWLGGVHAGLWCELRGGTYHGPMLNVYKPAPPVVWANAGKGGVRIEDAAQGVLATAFSGECTLVAGKPVTYEFALLITPLKPLDPAAHFKSRYWHLEPEPPPRFSNPDPTPEAWAAGVNVVNVHQGTTRNPHISYPFLRNESLRELIRDAHARNARVKLYYSVRELSNYAVELWALRSLGAEIIQNGGGGGFPWMREHMIGNYGVAWYHPFPDGSADAAFMTSFDTRWYNYYVEGLRWLVKSLEVDGLYLDAFAYDREIVKRLRRVMEQERPGCLIDLHENNVHSPAPANQYMEALPYVDRLWFGEFFKYDAMTPDEWLVQVSGLPYGLMGDMLQKGGNQWRGPLYGMTSRLPWTTGGVVCDPRNVWKAWDQFGIADSRMIGYWERDCPVKTDNKDVLATVYVKQGKALIALASWADKPVSVHLAMDWKALGLEPGAVTITAPEVERFQPARTFTVGEPITVESGKGWMLFVDERLQKESRR